MMSEYNRSNPFMYLLETKHYELVSETQIAIKHGIYLFLSNITFFIIFIIHGIFTEWHSLPYLIVLFLSVFIGFEIRRIVRSSKTQEINQMIFSDQFQNINLNNEKLMADIVHFSKMVGRVEILSDHVNIIFIISIMAQVSFLLDLMAHFII